MELICVWILTANNNCFLPFTSSQDSLLAVLTVSGPEIKVVDEQGYSVSDRYYKTGSTIELTCRAVTSIILDHRVPNKLHWIKDEKPLTRKVKTSSYR